jgi:hypothetical protein
MKKSIWLVLVGVVLILSGMTTAGVVASQYGGAQADKEKQKPAKPHTMTGCLEKGTEPNTFRLTNVEGTGPKTVELHADASKKLSAHLGHKIAVTGPEVDPATMKKGTTGKTEPGAAPKESSTEHHMRVNSLKMISETCS